MKLSTLALTGAASFALATAAHAQTPDICNTQFGARLMMEAFDEAAKDLDSSVTAVDVSNRTTMAATQHFVRCHGSFQTNTSFTLNATITVRQDAAGEWIYEYANDASPNSPWRQPAPVPTYAPMPVQPFMPPVTQAPQVASYQAGLTDRRNWEARIASVSGDYKAGAVWWTGQRSLAYPGACSTLWSADAVNGCIESKAMLDPTDYRRKTDVAYRQGWNAY